MHEKVLVLCQSVDQSVSQSVSQSSRIDLDDGGLLSSETGIKHQTAVLDNLSHQNFLF